MKKRKNPITKKSTGFSVRMDGYDELLHSVSSLIEEGRKVAVRQINTVLTATYWLMGRRIVEYEQGGKKKARYGEALLVQLAQDLTQRFGRGFSKSNIFMMRAFYLEKSQEETFQTRSGKSMIKRGPNQIFQVASGILDIAAEVFPLSWSHYCLLLKIKEPEKRNFYEKLSVQHSWSVRQLDRELQTMLFERTSLSKRKELVLSKSNKNPIIARPEDEIKNSYVLDFLNLKNEYSESDLEDALIQHLESFLLELGTGFTFFSRQQRFISGGYEYKMDLILYSIPLGAFVILELKLGRFVHSYAGQMNHYLNWTKENLVPKAENDPIGIILCADKEDTCVKYATMGYNKIFVSKYQLELPKPDDLQRELEKGRDLFLKNKIYQKNNRRKVKKE